jgi:hypothetical protein
MARDLTTDFKNGITAGTVRPVVTIVGDFDSETLRFWNGIGQFSYGGDTYTGAGVLLKVTDVTETQNIEARGASFELSGIPSSLLAVALDEPYQDRPVTQTFHALDSDGVSIADPFEFFSGKADVMSIEEGGKYATIKLTAESDLIILGRINERRRTPEDQKLTYAGDTFFDQVAALQSKDIVWGKNG